MLKVLAQEPVKADVKYGIPVEVESCYNVILTNDLNLIQHSNSDANLAARLKLIKLPAGVQATWSEIRPEEMEVLLLTVLSNLMKAIGLEHSANCLHYGSNCPVMALP